MPQWAELPFSKQLLWIPAIALVGLAMVNASQGHYLSGLTTIVFAIIAILLLTGLASPEHRAWPLRLASILVALTIVPGILTQEAGLVQWSYLLPLVFGLIWPLRWTCLLVTLTLPLFVIASLDPELGPDRHQTLAAALVTILLALAFLFMTDYRARQLSPLRRTDELTQAASREYLSSDLHKEIQRSEREGLELAVMLIGIEPREHQDSVDLKQLSTLLPRVGRFLHSQLRDFDSYYRVGDLEFLILLPGMNTAKATRQGEALRKGIDELVTSHGHSLSVTAGVAGLNIGDDAVTLQQAARRALRRAQKQGGNRTQSFSAWSGAADHQQEQTND